MLHISSSALLANNRAWPSRAHPHGGQTRRHNVVHPTSSYAQRPQLSAGTNSHLAVTQPPGKRPSPAPRPRRRPAAPPAAPAGTARRRQAPRRRAPPPAARPARRTRFCTVLSAPRGAAPAPPPARAAPRWTAAPAACTDRGRICLKKRNSSHLVQWMSTASRSVPKVEASHSSIADLHSEDGDCQRMSQQLQAHLFCIIYHRLVRHARSKGCALLQFLQHEAVAGRGTQQPLLLQGGLAEAQAAAVRRFVRLHPTGALSTYLSASCRPLGCPVVVVVAGARLIALLHADLLEATACTGAGLCTGGHSHTGCIVMHVNARTSTSSMWDTSSDSSACWPAPATPSPMLLSQQEPVTRATDYAAADTSFCATAAAGGAA